MFRTVYLFFFLCFFKLFASASEAAQPTQMISSPLRGENNFLVYYVFEDREFADQLKEIMVSYLKKIGTVYPADDSKLSEKEERAKQGSMIEIVTSDLIEDTLQNPVKTTKLPVMKVSFKMLTGVEVLKNSSKQACAVWEREKFIGDISKSKELKEKTIKTFDQIMNDFIEDYKIANPTEKETKFFLFA